MNSIKTAKKIEIVVVGIVLAACVGYTSGWASHSLLIAEFPSLQERLASEIKIANAANPLPSGSSAPTSPAAIGNGDFNHRRIADRKTIEWRRILSWHRDPRWILWKWQEKVAEAALVDPAHPLLRCSVILTSYPEKCPNGFAFGPEPAPRLYWGHRLPAVPESPPVARFKPREGGDK